MKAGRVQAWVLGPGLGDDTSGLHDVLASDVPVLIDADGLRLADPATVRARTAPTVLTPHAGEAAALLGVTRDAVEAERLESVRELAARYDATVLLKGSTTLVSPPDETRPARVNPTGTPWLATAGSGDVLSGLTGSLLAAGLAPLDAASVGAHLHGLAARRGGRGADLGAGRGGGAAERLAGRGGKSLRLTPAPCYCRRRPCSHSWEVRPVNAVTHGCSLSSSRSGG